MTAFRCDECNHTDAAHEVQQIPKSGNCSFGWCRCSQLRGDVQASGTAVTVTPIPAFNHATGKWAAR